MNKETERGRYLLREAGGSFWLLDLSQSGVPYRPPLRLNESGAAIWRMREEGLTLEEMAGRLAEEGGPSPDELRADLESFLKEIENRLNGDG